MTGKFESFGRVIDRCESFIERRLAIALLFSEQFSFEPTDEKPYVARDALGVMLAQQLVVGAHRLDFALTHVDGARLAIELDGHEFHDGSKERAERDRARDRDLLAAKWPTVRFTGREINRDAMRCAQEAHRLIVSAVPSLMVPARDVPSGCTSYDAALRACGEAEARGDQEAASRWLTEAKRVRSAAGR